MAAITTIIAAAALVVGAVSAYNSYEAGQDAKDASQAKAESDRNIQAEQRAANAQSAADERRKQVREERIQRARVLQSAENSGAELSSAEYGAIGSLGTQLSSNIGTNVGAIARSGRISQYAQDSANFGLQIQNSQISQQNANQLLSLSGSIFSAAGGTKTVQTAYTNYKAS